MFCIGTSKKKDSTDSGYKIPKKNPLLTPTSSASIGSERNTKFLNKDDIMVKIGVNSSVLLSKETEKLCNNFEKLLMKSVTASTWKRHSSAWSLLKIFCTEYKVESILPFSMKNMRAFVTWAITVRGLQASTVETYMSSIVLAHELSGNTCEKYSKDRCIQLILNGGKNISLLEGEFRPTRLAMNVDILKILGHRIAIENWDVLSKQVIWSACVICFYTSCRMGELVPENRDFFDAKTTLTWENVKFLENNEAMVFLPYTKTTGLKGAIVDIFPLAGNVTCPMEALKLLRKIYRERGIFQEKSPVFTFSTGKFLTVRKLNETLSSILCDFEDDFHKISCHSFRAGLPSIIAANPDKATVNELKEWGRWHSGSFDNYTKNERDKKRVLFYKYMKML